MYTAAREIWLAGNRYIPGDVIPDDVIALHDVRQAVDVGAIVEGTGSTAAVASQIDALKEELNHLQHVEAPSDPAEAHNP